MTNVMEVSGFTRQRPFLKWPGGKFSQLAVVNPDLIHLYHMLSVSPKDDEKEAKLMYACLNTPDGYSAIRDQFNAQRQSGPEKAAACLYLNRHCFNQQTRYNLPGEFNVGFGKDRAPYFPD